MFLNRPQFSWTRIKGQFHVQGGRENGSGVEGAGLGRARVRAEGIRPVNQRRRWTRPSGTLGSCRWRTSCCGSGLGPRSTASLCRCGGRADERDDLRDHGTALRPPAGVSGVGSPRARGSYAYARLARAQARQRGAVPARRGPAPVLSDAQLLAAIRADLARSPFHGEGHRKIHARLRLLDGVRVARTRVLRVMRAHGLLAPHRWRQGDSKRHDWTIITAAPRVMWGTDGVRVFTVDEGWVWTFAAIEPIAKGLEHLYARSRRTWPAV